MPIYGEAKRRDMIRSILPSSARRGARENLATIKRSARTRVNQSLSRFEGASSAAIDRYDDDAEDLEFYPYIDIKYAVYDRRDGDKVAPFLAWAKAVTKDIPQEERLSFLRGMLPDNTIGRHACQHAAFLEEFRDPRDLSYYTYRYRPSAPLTQEERAWKANCEIAALVFRMEKMIAGNGLLKRFNKSKVAYKKVRHKIPHKNVAADYGIRSWEVIYDRKRNEWFYWSYGTRPLLGAHDIPSFLSEFTVKDGWNSYGALNEVLNELGV